MTCPDSDLLLAVSTALRGHGSGVLPHLQRCPDCRATLQTLTALSAMAPATAVSPELLGRVETALLELANAETASARAPISTEAAPQFVRTDARPRVAWRRRLVPALAIGLMLWMFAAPPAPDASISIDAAWAVLVGVLGSVLLGPLERLGRGPTGPAARPA